MDTVAEYGGLTHQQQDEMIKAHAILVKRIAYHLLGRLPQSILLEDLM